MEGRIQTRQWEDQTGNKRYTTELIPNPVQSLERRDPGEDGIPPPDEPSGGEATGSSDQGPTGGSASGATGGS